MRAHVDFNLLLSRPTSDHYKTLRNEDIYCIVSLRVKWRGCSVEWAEDILASDVNAEDLLKLTKFVHDERDIAEYYREKLDKEFFRLSGKKKQ